MNPRWKNLGVESRASPEVADLTGSSYFLLQGSFWARDVRGFGTLGQGLVVFPLCKMASAHAVQIQNQGGHGPTSASDLIFLVLCGEKEDCSLFAQTSKWCLVCVSVRSRARRGMYGVQIPSCLQYSFDCTVVSQMEVTPNSIV